MLINKVKDKLDIIILAGQSNAEGWGIGPCENTYMPSADILSMKDTDNYGYVVDEKTYGTFHITMPRNYLIGIAEERQGTKSRIGCLALSFASGYKEKYLEADRKILIIHSAVGATGFAKGNWGIGSVLYERLCEMTRLALDMNSENRIVAVLWHQGEHDAIFRPQLSDIERENTYFTELSSMVGDYRKKFGTYPFIMGGFTDEWGDTYPKSQCIIRAMNKLTENCSRCALVNTRGLKTNNEELGNGDSFHFSRNSLNLLGERYFEAYEALK